MADQSPLLRYARTRPELVLVAEVDENGGIDVCSLGIDRATAVRALRDLADEVERQGQALDG